MIETETGIPAFAIPTNGMHDYTYGAGIALARIAERFTGESETVSKTAESAIDRESSVNQPHTLNLLGVTPLDFGPQINVDIMKKNLQKYGWEVVSSWLWVIHLKICPAQAKVEMNLVVFFRGTSGCEDT